MTVENMLATLLKAEGGWVNNPDDPGGETNFGVTVAVARENGFTGPMRDMTREDATRIYRAVYFDKPGFAQVFAVSPAIGGELFDTGVNMGVAVASKFLQRCLNALNGKGRDYADLAVDGQLGPSSLAALKAFLAKRGDGGEHVLLKALNCLQGARYIELAERNVNLESFVYGWLANRVDLSLR